MRSNTSLGYKIPMNISLKEAVHKVEEITDIDHQMLCSY